MSKYHVQRSIQIAASPDKVFEVVSDFGTWTSWSPWLCAQPDARVTTSSDASSVGSTYAWEGDVVGAGEIEHRKLVPGELIDDEIRFKKPFRSTSNVSFDLRPVSLGTEITWHMRGSLPWFLFWMRSQIEVFIGMDYERGLKMLKEWIETGTVQSETIPRGVVPIGPLRMLGVRGTCAVRDVSRSMEAAFARALESIENAELSTDGEMITVYHKFDMKAQIFDFTSGYIVPDSATSVPAGLSSWSTPAVQALQIEHQGSYEHLGNSWSAAHQIARYKKLKLSKEAGFEIYRVAGDELPAMERRTEIYLPLRG